MSAANLGQSDEAVASFGAFLKLQPGATIESAVYSKKAVAEFEKAQKAAAERAPSLAEAYKEFRPPADAKDRYPADQYWGDGAVRWIMTDSEKAAWSAITDPNARVTFVEEFWTIRAAVPGADGRTYRQEFERRVAFADANLAEDEEQRGSGTDRGMVFILLGPPTYAGRKPLRVGDDAADDGGLSTVTTHDVENTERQRTPRRRRAAAEPRAPPAQPRERPAQCSEQESRNLRRRQDGGLALPERPTPKRSRTNRSIFSSYRATGRTRCSAKPIR